MVKRVKYNRQMPNSAKHNRKKEMSINRKRNKSHTMRYSSSRLRLMSEWSDSYPMAYIEWKWGAAPIYQPQLQQQHIIRVHTD